MTDTSPTELSKAYEPKEVEQRWYKYWLEKGYFKPVIDKNRKPFVIIMPPPNITGELHLGHALTATLEDIMIRWHRMKGEPTLWLPGVDHAGIGAQVVVERILAKEGTSRHKLGREKFTERMWAWANSCRDTIRRQHMRLGASCDWDKETFTLDPGPVLAVRTAFVNLYNKGLIYRGERIINWCPRCCTALSDLEVDHKDLAGHLWYLRYPLEDGSGFVTVATTRPETMLGDTAVAVNPADERYQSLIGKKAILPIMDRVIPIIADDVVDTAFGTGAVKVTPAHDPVDFDIAGRHQLPVINILAGDVRMNQNAGPCAGMERGECRKWVVEELERQGRLEKVEEYSHAVGHCQRCATVVEPTASKQWFVRMGPLAKPAVEAVTSGTTRIVPQYFEKVYLNWMENIRDWCISRQLWWGHRIPVWYCPCGEVIAAIDEPKTCPKCGSSKLEQDPDVLDTWFSSGLWPHSTLGWPEKTADLAYFYPTSVMETGYDIIFFWVARMMMLGLEDMGEVPFRTVYLHGLIRDEKGVKMSKTRGNAIEPLSVMDTYGTDALRFGIVFGTTPGNDSKLGDTKLEAARNFANKLWNACRFILLNLGPAGEMVLDRDRLTLDDRWLLSRLQKTIAEVDSLMAAFQFAEAQRLLQDFIWGELCDWYIELAKIRLRQQDASPRPVLVYALNAALRLLHPFMPFITEELWQQLRQWLPGDLKGYESIMITPFPVADSSLTDEDAEHDLATVIEVIRAVRNARAEHKVEAGRWIAATIYAGDRKALIEAYGRAIGELGRIQPLEIEAERFSGKPAESELALVLEGVDVIIPMATMVDQQAEQARLAAEVTQLGGEIARLEALLGNAEFAGKAPPVVVAREREKLAGLKDRLARLSA